jgi:hypothetical protein
VRRRQRAVLPQPGQDSATSTRRSCANAFSNPCSTSCRANAAEHGQGRRVACRDPAVSAKTLPTSDASNRTGYDFHPAMPSVTNAGRRTSRSKRRRSRALPVSQSR